MKTHVIRTFAAAVAMAATVPVEAKVVNLHAGVTTVTMPDGVEVTLWGFTDDPDFPVTVPGPIIVVDPGDPDLTINLTNNLSVPVSIVIPGQPAAMTPVWIDNGTLTAGGARPSATARMRSFTHETPPGGTGVYSWTGLQPGSYLYHSGTHPAVQVQMGLYGAVTKDHAVGEAYQGVAYDAQAIVFFSEIDRTLHEAVVDGTYTSAVGYSPDYYLVNGTPVLNQTPLGPFALSDRVLLRFFNAGLEAHVPTLLDRLLTEIAEDGNPCPYPHRQYGVEVTPGQTKDALLVITAQAGKSVLFDRALNVTDSPGGDLGGLVAYIEAN